MNISYLKTIIPARKNLVLLGLTILFFASCHHEEVHHEEQAHFIVTSPLEADTAYTKEYVCQIRSIRHIELRALEKGYIQDIYVDEGKAVHQGQPLFQIMPTMYQAELNKALAEVKYSEIEYLNTKQLADSQIVSASELALAKANFDKAKAQLALAQVHLDFTLIKAPFDGIMGRLEVRQGSLVDEGELLSSLSDNSKMWVYFNVPEAEYLEYSSTMKKDHMLQVQLMMANQAIFPEHGIVETIEADFNNHTGNIAFRATFPNSNGLLRHGGTGNILVKSPLGKVLMVPQKSTFEILDHRYVYVINAEDELELRRITTGEEFPNLFVVTDGLSASDRILYEGFRKVKAHDKIEYEVIAPEEVVSKLDLYAE